MSGIGFIASVYEQALSRDAADFAAEMVSRCAQSLGASAAFWMIGQPAAQQPALIHRSPGTGSAGKAGPATWWRLGQTPLTGAVEVRHIPERVGGGRIGGDGSQVLLSAQDHAGTLFRSVFAFVRDGADAPFTPQQLHWLGELLPHLARVYQLAEGASLRFDHQLRQAGRHNRGVACLCDDSGAIFAMGNGFQAAVAARFPDWDGLRLPFLLSHAAPSRRAAQAMGLHLRVEFRGGLNVVYVRATNPLDELTQRERDIVKAMVGGHSYKVAARQLGVSASTVANHASNIYRKLGVFSRDDVVALARRVAVSGGGAVAAAGAG